MPPRTTPSEVGGLHAAWRERHGLRGLRNTHRAVPADGGRHSVPQGRALGDGPVCATGATTASADGGRAHGSPTDGRERGQPGKGNGVKKACLLDEDAVCPLFGSACESGRARLHATT